MVKTKDQGSLFLHVLPPYRLGKKHTSLESYDEAVRNTARRNETQQPTEFSLVVLLSPNNQQGRVSCSNISILLGKKLRGFGKGFYNCFGGKLEKKLDEHKHPARGAVREVHEETGIIVPLDVMEESFVGNLDFTFDDWEVNKAMKVHLYCVVLSMPSKHHDANSNTIISNGSNILAIDPEMIRGCEEIEPVWFGNAYDIPLHQMFADDSIWLTELLKHYDTMFKSIPSPSISKTQTKTKFMFDAWFHFQAGGADTNHILHRYVQINQSEDILCSTDPPRQTKKKITLEKQLFHALHLNHIHSPSIKEFKENYAMANAVRRHMGDEDRMEYVIDVAGGHGALGKYVIYLDLKCNQHDLTVVSYHDSCFISRLDKEMPHCYCH